MASRDWPSSTRPVVMGIPKHDGKGFPIIPDTSGIGVELKPDAVRKCPMKPREVVTRLHVDGSVVDQ